MKLSELQKKNIIDIKSGRIVGKIIDVEFDINSGYLIHFIIEKDGIFRNLFTTNDEISVNFSQIDKMGEDVILIDFKK